MFGSKSRPKVGRCHPGGSPWDEETIAFIATTPRLIIQIAHVEQRFMAGSIWGTDPSYKVIASGVLSCPIQHVTCTISFEGLPNNEGYGLVTLDYLPWTGGGALPRATDPPTAVSGHPPTR